MRISGRVKPKPGLGLGQFDGELSGKQPGGGTFGDR